MRIAIIADPVDEQYAGIYTYTKNLIENLVKIDHENEYFFVHVRKNSFFTGKGKEIIIPLWRWMPGHATLRKFFIIPWILRKYKVDVVHEPAHIAPFLFFSGRYKKIVTIHDLTPVLSPQWHRFLSGLIHRLLFPLVFLRADQVITTSEHTKKDIKKCYHPKCPITVVYQAAKKKQSIQQILLKKPFFLHVGTIEPRKNLSFLIKVFEYLKSKYSIPHHLYLIGKKGWKSESFFEILKKSPYSQDIVLEGFLSDEELSAYYTQADCFVFPTLYEGFGLPILEAMQYGCPVVASNNSSLPEVVGEGGVLADETSVEKFAEAIDKIISNADQFKKAALEQVTQFSWVKCARETLNVYTR